SARLGAQLSHSWRCSFQHTSGHTQWPHRVHWWNFGLISSIASLNALSHAEPRRPSFMYSLAWPAAHRLWPPNRLPRPLTILAPTPSADAWNVERYPLWHLSQKNSNWY